MTVKRLIVIAVCSLLLLVTAGYFALSPPVSRNLYENYVFQPKIFPAGYYESRDNLKLKPEDIWFSSKDSTRLHGWFFPNPEAKKVVLFVHGKGGNVSYRSHEIEQLLKAGLSVFIFDFRGYGKSNGKPSLDGIYGDVLAAYEYLTISRGYAPANIVLLGESLGSGFVCKLSREKEHAGIILYAPFTSLREAGTEILPITRIYPVSIFPEPDLDNLAILEKPHKLLLIIHGVLDEVITVYHSKQLYRQASEPKRLLIVPDAGHVKCAQVAPLAFRKAIIDFLSGL